MKNYKCEICGKEFEKQIEFAKHILKCEENRKKEEEAKIRAQKEAEKEERSREIERTYQTLEEMIDNYLKEFEVLKIKNRANKTFTIDTNINHAYHIWW